MAEPLGVGLVGAGGFGEFCSAAFQQMREVRLVAVADVVEARAAACAPPGAKVYTRYAAVLADPAVDIVAINTPPYLHAAMVVEGAAAGKHLFVEKPLATSMLVAVAAVRAARRAGVLLTVDYVLRFHPLHVLAASIVASGAFGSLQHWSLENYATDEPLLPDHWFWDTDQSGGVHVEHGVHFIDLCNQMVGRAPDSVGGTAQRRADGRVDRVSATARYGDDVLATFFHSFTQIRAIEQTTIRVGCARGHLTLEGWIPTQLAINGLTDAAGLDALRRMLGNYLRIERRFAGEETIFRHGGATETLAAEVSATVTAPDRQGDYRRAIQDVMRNLVSAIRGVELLRVTPEDGLQSLAVALAARDTPCGGMLPTWQIE